MDKTAVYGVIGVFVTSCAFVLGVLAIGVDDVTVPIVTSLLSTGGIIIVQILTGQRTDRKVNEVDAKVERVLNGEMDTKIQTVLVETLNDDMIDPEYRTDSE